MSEANFVKLLLRLASLPQETEWVEFKASYAVNAEIGEYISALSNSARLVGQPAGYLVFGVKDADRSLIGTRFSPGDRKQGNEELENWLCRLLEPQVNFDIFEFEHETKSYCIFKVQPAHTRPVKFNGEAYIRIGTYKKKLVNHVEKERMLWRALESFPFEKGFAANDLKVDDVLHLIDVDSFFRFIKLDKPQLVEAVIDRLRVEEMIVRSDEGLFSITNLGGILFARDLKSFGNLSRKAVRVVHYVGKNRIETKKEWLSRNGYAAGFETLIDYVNEQLPVNEHIGRAFREERLMYPEIAIRELVANAIIHQDFDSRGGSPLVEIFEDRVEISNFGPPLIDIDRLIDEPPQSRNEGLAGFMRRIGICEERGSGIDKVVFYVELYQLPAPDFRVSENHMIVVLYGDREFRDIDKNERIRACYQHACLKYVSNDQMTNSSLRQRFSIADKDYPVASRVISDTLSAGLIKSYDPNNKSRKHAKYVPFWA